MDTLRIHLLGVARVNHDPYSEEISIGRRVIGLLAYLVLFRKRTLAREMLAALFRPAPDPEISDHEAELDFPVSNRFIRLSDVHVRWLEDQKKASYGCDGYPRTLLSYNYDWGNPETEVGLSEFVIRKNASVVIHSVSTINDYCRGQKPVLSGL